MKLAVDVQVSNEVIGSLCRAGDEVVCVARMGEEDQSWVSRALDRGAEILISPDLDIPNLLDQWGINEVFHFVSIHRYQKWKKRVHGEG